MSRLTKVSSIRASRVHEMYVQRFSNSQTIAEVESISPVRRTENETTPVSENKLMAYDLYYDKIENQSPKALKPITHTSPSQKKDLYTSLTHFITKYNLILAHFKEHDHLYGTDYTKDLIELYKKFRPKIKPFHLNNKGDFLKLEYPKTFQSEQWPKAFAQLNHFQIESLQIIQRFVKEAKHSTYPSQLIAAHQAKGMIIEAYI
ncbi:hypothetical protein [Alkalihalobacillus sp. 1P02AB]|uniref:hypothetical protein n=1 Tax=Alkalihalobacillus sp. 1P02AB TaxID=3132260 RepID=UPI0039A46A2D